MIITGVGLKQLCPLLKIEDANIYGNLFTEICPIYKIDSYDIFHDLIANVAHESKDMAVLVENLNYQVKALITKFGRHRISIDNCYRYGRIYNLNGTIKQKANQVMIANNIYGGNWGFDNLGNVQKDDGWELRGSGLMQITGRYLMAKFAKYYNALKGTNYDLKQIAELLRTNKEVAVHGACWLFAIEKKLIDEAIADQVKQIRKSINGGTFGLNEVIELTNKAQSIFK